MRFQPKTEKELHEEKMLPEGEHSFEVSQGEDTFSKNSGNEMIKLLVRVFREDGTFLLIDDYLLESMGFKLRHAAEACGLIDRYENGELSGEDFIGKTGTVKIGTQEAKGDWPAKSVIKDYVVEKEDDAEMPAKKEKATKTKAVEDLESDEIPFAIMLPLAGAILTLLASSGIA